MNITKFSELIANAFKAIEEMVSIGEFYTDNTDSIIETRKRLTLVLDAVKENPKYIDTKILRYVVYLGVASYRFFENTPLENALSDVSSYFYDEVPSYRNLDLKPL